MRLTREDGRTIEVGPGAIIGRLSRADVVLPDPRVSEAHALISLRGEAFHLLALRGRFVVDGTVLTDQVLEPGLRIQFSPTTTLTVTAVELPSQIPAVRAAGLPDVPLPGVMSLHGKPHPSVRSGYHADASAHLFPDDDAVLLVQAGRAPQTLAIGDTVTVDGAVFTLSAVPLVALSAPKTQTDGRVDEPLHIVARYDSVHIQRQGSDTLVVPGIAAKIIGELVAMGNSAPWEVVAGEIWPDSADARDRLRHRLDAALFRLRSRLNEARVRADLVQMDGCGQLELVLHRQDTVTDEV